MKIEMRYSSRCKDFLSPIRSKTSRDISNANRFVYKKRRKSFARVESYFSGGTRTESEEFNVTANVMEDKLESYRLRKRRTKVVATIKEKFFGMFTSAGDDESRETKVCIEVSKSSGLRRRYCVCCV